MIANEEQPAVAPWGTNERFPVIEPLPTTLPPSMNPPQLSTDPPTLPVGHPQPDSEALISETKKYTER